MGRLKGSNGRRRRGMSTAEGLTKTQGQRYTDPSFLQGVPFGDLAHLSDERNTGAARANLHEVWKCPLSTI